MAVDATLLFREVDAIIRNGQSQSNYMIKLKIQANGVWYTPYRLDLWSLDRDYENGFADTLVVSFLMGLGTYTYKLLPFRESIVVDVQYIPLTPPGGNSRSAMETEVKRYRGLIMNQDNQGMVGKHSQATNPEELDKVATSQVEMQLVEEAAYQTKMISFGKNYRSMSPPQALQAALAESKEMVKGTDAQRILGITMAPGFNTEVRNQITIPHGTPVTKIPELIQEKQGGVYPAGLACYLQDQYWHIFPPYDTTRFSKSTKSLTILNIPKNRYYGAEKTYRVINEQVTIVAAGDASALDDTAFSHINKGNAMRFTDARAMFTSFGTTNKNRMLLDRATNVFEVANESLKTGMNNVQWASERATSNPFKHYSAMAKQSGNIVVIEWLHGDSDLLTPGMPVKFMTTTDDLLKTYEGVLLGVHEQRIPGEMGAQPSSYPSSIRLKLFLGDAKEDQP